MTDPLYQQYLEDESLHVSNTSDIILNVFNDALRIQAKRIVKNIMESLQCDRERAMKIAFCDCE